MIITLGGRAGAGKSSIGRALAEKLDYKFYSAGDVRRKYALEQGLTIAELNKRAENDPTSDFLVDDYMKKMAEKENNFVIDAWLGFYCFPKSIKIFLVADQKLRAQRIFERAKVEESSKDLEEALRLMNEKEDCSIARYKKLYCVDAYDLKNYDFVFDTTGKSVKQSTDMIYRYVMSRVKNKKK